MPRSTPPIPKSELPSLRLLTLSPSARAFSHPRIAPVRPVAVRDNSRNVLDNFVIELKFCRDGLTMDTRRPLADNDNATTSPPAAA